MTALAVDRLTKERAGDQFARPVAATTRIFGGSIVCLNAAGNAIPGATATGLIVDGVAEAQVDNRNGAAGALSVVSRRGVFQFANSASTDLITIAEIGDNCYIVDDQTVAKTNGSSTRSVAGKIEDVDANGVWVRF